MKTPRFIIILISMLILTACVSEHNQETVELTDDNHKTIYLSDWPSNLDPSKSSDAHAGRLLSILSEPLFRAVTKEDGSTEMVPAGAESVSVSEDGLTHTYTIRGDNKWHDGKKVTAKDYAYGIKRSLDPETESPYGILLMMIKNAQSVLNGTLPEEELGVRTDGNKLIIELAHEATYFEQLTALRVMYPQREDLIENDTYTQLPYSSGPYYIHSADEIQMVLYKNNHYWNAEEIMLEALKIKLTHDGFDSSDQLEIPGLQFLFFNTEDKLFKNEKVRLAVSLAIDREELVDHIYQGLASPAYGFIPPGVHAGEFIYRDHVEGPIKELLERHDPKELFSEGLEELGMDPADITVTLSFGAEDPTFNKLTQYLQERLRDVLGITLEAEYNTWNAYEKQVRNGDFQMGFIQWQTLYDSPSPLLNLLYSRASALGTGWFHEEYDYLVRQTYYNPKEMSRFSFAWRAEKLLLEEAPVAPLIFPLYEHQEHYDGGSSSGLTLKEQVD